MGLGSIGLTSGRIMGLRRKVVGKDQQLTNEKSQSVGSSIYFPVTYRINLVENPTSQDCLLQKKTHFYLPNIFENSSTNYLLTQNKRKSIIKFIIEKDQFFSRTFVLIKY